MMTIDIANTANRACSLIYSFIKEQDAGVWLLPVNVCPDVPLTFCSAKIPFEFVDINPTTLCIDENECLALLKKAPDKYRGIVYVRTYGYLFDTQNFVSECKRIIPSLKIIDDRCLCLPSFKPVLYGADMVLYSTGHCKQIDLGGGGLAFYSRLTSYNIDQDLIYDGTNEEDIYKKSYELNKPLEIIPTGWLKLDSYKDYLTYKEEIEVNIPKRIETRDELNKIYNNNLPDNIKLDSCFQEWRFNIRVPIHLKDYILSELRANNLFASSHYHSANRLFGNDIYNCSDNLYASVINLFNDKYYTTAKAEKTCEIINKIIK